MTKSVREKIESQIAEIEKTLYGMNDVIKVYCLSKASDLTVMLLGAHATAKSSLARLWSVTTGLEYRVVTSSEVDESLIAYIDPAVFREKNIVQMRRGELMEKDHIIVDEFMLWLNKYRAKLHQLLEEHTYAGLDVLTKTYTFLSNPLSEYYAGQIEEKNLATIDRIDLFVPVNQPQIVPCESMMRKFSRYGRKEKDLAQILSWDEYQTARKEISDITIPSRIVIWLTLFAHSMSSCKHMKDKFSVSLPKLKKMCAACNENAHLCGKVLLSKPRFLRATIILAKGLAWLDGRNAITFDDINEAVLYTLPHRLVFIQDDLSYAEALETVPEILQQFNDEMLAWKNRGIFSTLTEIIDSSKKPEPFFEEKKGNELLADVGEIHLLKEFANETIESVKEDISKYYLEEGRTANFIQLIDLRNYLVKSGLNPFERDALMYEIAENNKNLYLTFPITNENVEKLINTILSIHKKDRILIEEKTILEHKFSDTVAFDSDLLKIREFKGQIQILTANKNIRTALTKGLGDIYA